MQAPLGPNAITVPDDQHADHELGIDRGTPGVAVVVRQVLAKLAQVEAALDATQEVILGNVFVEIERVKQPVLTTCSTSHHHSAPRGSDGKKNHS